MATLDLAGHVAHDLWSVDGTSPVLPGHPEPGVYAVVRIDVTAPGMLSPSTSAPATGELASPTSVRDFDADGVLELGVIVGERLHLWELGPPPVLALDIVSPDDQGAHLEAVDLGADGTMEVFTIDEGGLRPITIADDEVSFGNYASFPGVRRGTAIVARTGEPDRLVVATESTEFPDPDFDDVPWTEDSPWTLVNVLVGTSSSPRLRDPFGAPRPFVWMVGADLDGDAKDEVLVRHDTVDQGLHIYRMSTAESPPQCHTPVTGVGMDHATTGDVTGDGIDDLVVGNDAEIQVWSLAPSR